MKNNRNEFSAMGETFDFRFVEIAYELRALKIYLETLEIQLNYLEEQERVRTKAEFEKLKKNTNETSHKEVYYELQDELNEKIQYLFPRFFRGPFIVTLWAVYESAIKKIAVYLKSVQGLSRNLKDIQGRFPENAKKYFKEVLKIPLVENNTSWTELKRLSILRHTIAHCNGQLDAIKNNTLKKIKLWEKQGVGISTEMETILFSKEFLEKAYYTVSKSLSDLMKMVAEKYPYGPQW